MAVELVLSSTGEPWMEVEREEEEGAKRLKNWQTVDGGSLDGGQRPAVAGRGIEEEKNWRKRNEQDLDLLGDYSSIKRESYNGAKS